jgi:hypothetical protein
VISLESELVTRALPFKEAKREATRNWALTRVERPKVAREAAAELSLD